MAEDEDDDDICPICEDECTCRNAGAAPGGYSAADDGDGGAPLPLFSQIINRTTFSLMGDPPSGAGSAPHPAIDSTAMPPSSPTEAAPKKTRARKARRTKGTSNKSLASHLVSAMGPRPPHTAHDGGLEEELDDSGFHTLPNGDEHAAAASSSDLDDAFVSAASIEQSRQAAAIAMAQATQLVQTKKKRGRPPKTAAAKASVPSNWQKRKALAASRVAASSVEPAVYEVDSVVIRGRGRRASPTQRRMASPKITPVGTDNDDDDDDEFINITDVTSDGSGVGFVSETEFDHKPGTSAGSISVGRAEWSDSRILDMGDDDDDEDIEQVDAEYLVRMQQSDCSSSSLSDLDDRRMEVIRGGAIDSDFDSGAESDSETSGSERGSLSRRRRRHRRWQQRRRHHRDRDGSDVGSIVDSDDCEPETDQELTFRSARTEKERALVTYGGSGDEREDALLEMHLDQMRAVRNVIQDCPSPLLGHATSSDDASERDIIFTYQASDSEDLSDDLMEGWGADTRKRWEGSSSDSSMSESKADKLRLKDDGDDQQSNLYSSDSYDEFYTHNAFLDMASDDATSAPELDLDNASLALGVALSMEQRGYSKEDAAAAAAVAAAAYPPSGTEGPPPDLMGKQPQTTITASMNAHGEADPIDGIVSIKSSSGRAGASRMASGTHTPFGAPDWRVAAATAAAAAYLDSSQPSTMSFVLPKDLNEARSPNVALSAAANITTAPATSKARAASSAGCTGFPMLPDTPVPRTATAVPTVTSAASDFVPPRASRAQSVSSSSAFKSQLPNSSFYKPLSSICSPSRSGSSGQTTGGIGAPLATAPPDSAPVVSLSAVNAALSALTEPPAPETAGSNTDATETPRLKRRANDLALDRNRQVVRRKSSGSGGDLELDLSFLITNGCAAPTASAADTATMPSMLEVASPLQIDPSAAMGAGTPMLSRYDIRHRGGLASDDDDDNGWLLAMDQLVDTDALLVESPPPSPATATGPSDGMSGPLSPPSVAADPFARWDRIPVNIFRRSRALAANHRRNIAASDDSMGAMSSLALTAIKSSRQRRTLVGSTLLTQHTLSSGRRGLWRVGSQGAPPPPPPTPLSSRGRRHDGAAMPSVLESPVQMRRSGSQGGLAGRRQSKALDFSRRPSAAMDLRGQPKQPVASSVPTGVGAPYELSSSHASDCSETAGGPQRPVAASNDDESDTGYAFGWLEDEEDLSLFAMPTIGEADDQQQQQPSLTMVLASTSPAMLPFRTADSLGPDAAH
ncbi:hypothetical protein GGF46_001901 [Coemansia sp. RSA 552]|nr:hypothetical protein GGF46_001901 [Coemansia sp. RSA 552]